ncbi:MAG: glycosyltransferase family 4 protein [Acidobacteriaceae bacterium]
MAAAIIPEMTSRLRVALVNRLDTENVRVLSGTPYFMAKALERQSIEVTTLGPVQSLWMEAGRYVNGAAGLFGKHYDWIHSVAGSRDLGRKFSSRLTTAGYDVIFAPFASTEIAYLKTPIPIVYLTDMTFKSAVSYYDTFSNLLPLTSAEGEMIEKRAIKQAVRIVVSSDWAAKSFFEDYHCGSEKIATIPFGVNLDDPPSREEALKERSSDVCKLLLLGVNWERKGGPLALQVLQSLLQAGIKAELLVCGCKPPAGVSHPAMRVLPFLSKDKPEEARQLRELLLTSTFLLLPSRSEALGIVFGEASACGLPSVTRDTGGISSVVRHGINGLCLPADASRDEYARAMLELLRNPARYRTLQVSSRDEFEKRLNWDTWASRMKDIFVSFARQRSRLSPKGLEEICEGVC